jgi:hypothetical protein
MLFLAVYSVHAFSGCVNCNERLTLQAGIAVPRLDMELVQTLPVVYSYLSPLTPLPASGERGKE